MSAVDQNFPDPEGICSGCSKPLFKDDKGLWRILDAMGRASCKRGGPHIPEKIPESVVEMVDLDVDWSSWEGTLSSWMDE